MPRWRSLAQLPVSRWTDLIALTDLVFEAVEHLLRAYGFKDQMPEGRRTSGTPKVALRAQAGARGRPDAVAVQKK